MKTKIIYFLLFCLIIPNIIFGANKGKLVQNQIVLDENLQKYIIAYIDKYNAVCNLKYNNIVMITPQKNNDETIIKVKFFSKREMLEKLHYNSRYLFLSAGKIKKRHILIALTTEFCPFFNSELTLGNVFKDDASIVTELELMNQLKGTKAYDQRYEGMCSTRAVPEMTLFYKNKIIYKVTYNDENSRILESIKKIGKINYNYE